MQGGSVFEPTCATVRWALMHHFASVCDWIKNTGQKLLGKNYWTLSTGQKCLDNN